jgi:GNAT superfamily N-acetyltransferase
MITACDHRAVSCEHDTVLGCGSAAYPFVRTRGDGTGSGRGPRIRSSPWTAVRFRPARSARRGQPHLSVAWLVNAAWLNHYGAMTAHQNPIDGRSRGGLVFAESTELDEEVFDRCYKEVLEPSFPPEELNDLATLRAAYRTPLPGFHARVAMRDGEPVAGAFGEFSAASGVMLLSWLAVRGDLRGQGIGNALLTDLLPRWRRMFDPVAVLAEVEDPRCHQASRYGDPAARLRFYERMGAKLLPVSHVQPSISSGLPRVGGMFLICLDPDREEIPSGAVADFLDEYISFCEGEQVMRTDPQYRDLREQVLSWPTRMPLWPMSRASEVPLTVRVDFSPS